jgi:hypothetical protein
VDHRGVRRSATLHSSSSRNQPSRQARSRDDAWARIGRLQEAQSAEREARAVRDRGVVHTPASVAALMAQRLLTGVRRGARLRVLDPGCGAAQLLIAVTREAARRDVRVACKGIEVDSTAVRWARDLGRRVSALCGSSLDSWRVQHTDYLATTWCRQRVTPSSTR